MWARNRCDVVRLVRLSRGGHRQANEAPACMRGRLYCATALEEDEHSRRALTRLGRAKRVGKGHWDRMENQRALMDSVAKRFNVKGPMDWRRVRNKDVVSLGGAPVLARYQSFAAALQAIYPEQDMRESMCRTQMPRKHWKSLVKRREFVASLAERMGVRTAEDWRRVRYEDVRSLPGGRGFLEQYPSLYAALRECWRPEGWGGEGSEGGEGESERELMDVFDMRKSVPQNHWDSKENVIRFVKRLERQLDVQDQEDWYRVSWEQVQQLGGTRMLAKKLYLVDALRMAYPDEKWQAERFSSTKKRARQRQLFSAVSAMLGMTAEGQQSS